MSAAFRPPDKLESPILEVIGHLGSAAALFVTLSILGWAVSWILNFLNSVQQFPREIHILLTRLEIVLIYLDTIVSGSVLLWGAARFLRDLFWGNRR